MSSSVFGVPRAHRITRIHIDTHIDTHTPRSHTPHTPQESPNDIPEGETPMGVTLYSYDTLVDVARPGDRVTITGIYRAAAVRANPRQVRSARRGRVWCDVGCVVWAVSCAAVRTVQRLWHPLAFIRLICQS